MKRTPARDRTGRDAPRNHNQPNLGSSRYACATVSSAIRPPRMRLMDPAHRPTRPAPEPHHQVGPGPPCFDGAGVPPEVVSDPVRDSHPTRRRASVTASPAVPGPADSAGRWAARCPAPAARPASPATTVPARVRVTRQRIPLGLPALRQKRRTNAAARPTSPATTVPARQKPKRWMIRPTRTASKALSRMARPKHRLNCMNQP